MSIIALILKFAFFFFMAFFMIILWAAFALYRRMARARHQLNSNNYQYQEPSSTKNTIVDNRPVEERRKQVIPNSEGEYIDFTESDDTQS